MLGSTYLDLENKFDREYLVLEKKFVREYLVLENKFVREYLVLEIKFVREYLVLPHTCCGIMQQATYNICNGLLQPVPPVSRHVVAMPTLTPPGPGPPPPPAQTPKP